MLLKVLTTALVLTGLALVFGLPFMLGAKPRGDDNLELAQYGTRLLTYFTLTSVAWLGAALCASLIVRRARKEFVERQRENLQGLIEGTLRDHESKR